MAAESNIVAVATHSADQNGRVRLSTSYARRQRLPAANKVPPDKIRAGVFAEISCIFNAEQPVFPWPPDCTTLCVDQGLLIAAAGMRAQIETLELLGNNLANAATTGFKSDREFFRLFQTGLAEPDPATSEIRWMPVVQGSAIDFEQGTIERTEGAFDVALSGPGFLMVETPGGARLYTRNGAFHLSAQGRLETAEGYAVLDAGGKPIRVPPGEQIRIGDRGMLRSGSLNVALLGVVTFPGRPPLTKVGLSYFQAPEGVETQPAAETVVKQGYLESSNVNVPLAAVQLIQTSRNFEMLSRIAALVADQMNGRAVEQLGSLR
jgi:flagellar basal-body rod protein FlgF/flagellar basal-body rod protein FlgG